MMKNYIKLFAVIALFAHSANQKSDAQGILTETFESYISPKDSGTVLNGSNGTKSINIFSLSTMYLGWDTSFGGYWAKNWAVSSVINNTIEASNYTKHLYAASPGWGASGYGDRVFTVGQNFAGIGLNNPSDKYTITSIQISNSTFAFNSMKFGDAFGKKFKHTDRDSFVLIIHGFNNQKEVSTQHLVLADFRDADTTKNYILRTWKKVNFNKLEDSLNFELVSSDNGMFGMNTPAFFVMDDLELNVPDKINRQQLTGVPIYPNPCASLLNIGLNSNELKQVSVYSLQGELISVQTSNQLDITSIMPGLYTIIIEAKNGAQMVSKVLKN